MHTNINTIISELEKYSTEIIDFNSDDNSKIVDPVCMLKKFIADCEKVAKEFDSEIYYFFGIKDDSISHGFYSTISFPRVKVDGKYMCFTVNAFLGKYTPTEDDKTLYTTMRGTTVSITRHKMHHQELGYWQVEIK